MRLINHTKPRILIADEGKHFRDKNDVYVSSYVDDMGEKVPAHYPHYMTMCFPAAQIETLEQALELYVEEPIE